MLATLLGIVTLARLVQSKNALFPMLVTLVDIVMLAKLVQYQNAESPRLMTLSGIVTLARVWQFANAESQMPVTGRLTPLTGIELGMVTAPPGPEYPVMMTVASLFVA